MSKYNCEKCGKELKPNELKYMSCGSYEFICNDCAEKQIPSKLMEKIADLEAKLAERGKEIAIRNQKLNELKTELHKRDESLQRKKQQVGDVHKAVKQAKRESVRKGRQVCYANNEVVKYQKQIKELKQQLAEKSKELQECKIGDKNTQDALFSKIQKLEQQLAEKDKEIKDLNYRLDLKFVNYTNNEAIKFLEDQDKISFCIEQLEKVKEFNKKVWGTEYAERDVDKFICDLINELKEMK